MMPPVCSICDEFLSPDDNMGGLTTFSLTEEQAEFNKRFEKEGFVGHPKGTFWFCGKHRPKAEDLKFLHSEEALKLMNLHFGLQPSSPESVDTLLDAFKKADRVTLEANKEFFEYLEFRDEKFYQVDGDTLAPDIENRVEISATETLRLLKNKLIRVAKSTYHIELKNDFQIVSFYKLYPFWFS